MVNGLSDSSTISYSGVRWISPNGTPSNRATEIGARSFGGGNCLDGDSDASGINNPTVRVACTTLPSGASHGQPPRRRTTLCSNDVAKFSLRRIERQDTHAERHAVARGLNGRIVAHGIGELSLMGAVCGSTRGSGGLAEDLQDYAMHRCAPQREFRTGREFGGLPRYDGLATASHARLVGG